MLEFYFIEELISVYIYITVENAVGTNGNIKLSTHTHTHTGSSIYYEWKKNDRSSYPQEGMHEHRRQEAEKNWLALARPQATSQRW